MKKLIGTIFILLSVKFSYSQTTSPTTNFGTTGSCCATATNGYTIGVSEATNTNGKLPTLQFHTSGYHEAFFRLASDIRVFEIGDNQAIGVDFAIRNPANSLRNVYLSGKGSSYFNGGNLGIGTVSPTEKLDIVGNVKLSGTLKFGNSGTRTEYRNNAGLQGNLGSMSGFYESYEPQNFPSGASSWWHLLDTRHSNPDNNYAMQLAGSFFDQKMYFRKTNNSATQDWKEIVAVDATGKINLDNDAASLKKSVIIGSYVYGGAIKFNAHSGVANNRNLELGNTDNSGIFYPSITVNAENRNVGIGTTSIPTDYKLAVGGNIIAEKVVVKLKADWPDYVFKKTYDLRSLEQVEQYINQNSHLPEVPSADEINKTGIDLGQINTKLLQKVEEITLYLINQSKEIKMQNNKIENLQNEIHRLRNRN